MKLSKYQLMDGEELLSSFYDLGYGTKDVEGLLTSFINRKGLRQELEHELMERLMREDKSE